MRRTGLAAAFALLAASPALAAPATAPRVTLEAVHVRLLYSVAGGLSEDMAGDNGFNTGNAITGAGPNDDPADDALVSASLTTDVDELNMSTPLSIVVRDSRRRLIASRTFREVFFKRGKATAYLFLPDSTCDGAITVTATVGHQTKTASVEMHCGE
jgi:hypothetical protein